MNTVVLVHGLWMPGAETALLRRRLRRVGFETQQFSYHSVAQDLAQNAHELAAFLERVPGETVHFVGHSLGGVVTLKMIQDHAPERIGRIVCLGSPVQGSTAGRTLARFPGGKRLIGKSLPAFAAGGPIGRWSSPHELGLIAGRAPLGGGQFLGGLSAPHDGTVAVAETRLAGATAHVVLPVSHLSMLWSRSVADQVASFLESGLFLPAELG